METGRFFKEVNVKGRIDSGGGFQSVWGIYTVLSGKLERLWMIHIGAQGGEVFAQSSGPVLDRAQSVTPILPSFAPHSVAFSFAIPGNEHQPRQSQRRPFPIYLPQYALSVTDRPVLRSCCLSCEIDGQQRSRWAI
jgi:hypothetical protein